MNPMARLEKSLAKTQRRKGKTEAGTFLRAESAGEISPGQAKRRPGLKWKKASCPERALGTPTRIHQLRFLPARLGVKTKTADALSFAPLRLCVTLILCFLTLVGAARAEDVSVSATLSSDTITLDDTAELQVTVQGSQKASPPQVQVEGLDIRYSGASTQVQMNNFNVTRSVKHAYAVLPQKLGTFTIPAISIEVDGKKLSTAPLKLTVASASNSGGGTSSNGGSTNADQPNAKFAAAEWVLPKTTAYVGEALPAELRLYVDQRVQCQLQQMPSFSGDGFTAQKFNQPQQRQVTKDGRNLVLVIFKTAITPVKAGKLTLPAAEINAVAVLPAKRPRMPRGMPGMDDVFNDPFFGGAFNAPQQVVIRPDPVEMEIKPLPTADRPRSFSGAVGQFTLETKAAPLRVRTGDPVTVTAIVTGVGSFDRMGAPLMGEGPGWRTYPPSGKFKADDEVGISGAKTFEAAVIAEAPNAEMPPVEFSFFNPSTEKYETLKGDHLALIVEGAPLASPTPAPVAAVPTATPAATPTPKANDIQSIQLDPGAWNASFEPVWRTRRFWLVQLAPLSALLALGGWRIRQAQGNNGALQRAASLQRDKAAAWSLLRREKIPCGEFYDAAIRILQIETVLRRFDSPIEPSTVDAEAACASRSLDAETAEGVRRLFAAHDQWRYAGVGAGSGADPIHPDPREQALRTLEHFEKSHV